MSKYSSYIDSETVWFDHVPSHWQLKRNKHFLNEVNERVGKESDAYDLLSLTKAGVILRDVESGKGKFPASYESYKIVESENLIFCLFDIQETPRTVGYTNLNGMITGAYKVFDYKRNIVDGKYIYYYYLSIDDEKGLKPYYTGLRNVIRPETFMSLKIHLPPLSEQTAIVSYLDNKTAKIDHLIRLKERKIELLKEKRLKLVERVLLNSNIKRIRLKHVVDLTNRPIDRKENETYTKIGMLNWGRGIFKYPDELGSDLGDSNFNYIKEGDLLLSGQFSWEGAVSIVEKEENDCISSHRFHILNGKENQLINEYLWTYFTSQEGHFLLTENSYGSAGRNRPLNIGKLLKEEIPVPDMNTQREIQRLVHEERLFKKYVSRSVNLLKEYRQSLISEVVTGKIRVCEEDPSTFVNQTHTV